MADLTADIWEQVVNQYRKSGSERTAVGVVIRSDLYGAMIAELTRSPLIYASGPVFYFDHHQSCEALVFYDDGLLRAYLNRRTDPDGWATVVAEAVAKETHEHR